MKVELIDITRNSEQLIEQAARLCTDTKENPFKRSGFIQRLIKAEHLSVLEHAKATFLITEVSRAMTHQLVRHRIASYSQRSQRYCTEDGLDFVVPEGMSEETEQKFLDTLARIEWCYTQLRRDGVKKEDARFILPNATPTKIMVTMNFRTLREFIQKRYNKKAQWEIREVARRMLNHLVLHAPNVFGDLINEKAFD